MSYSNNWLESISEAYKSKAKKKAYVKEDTETLLAIIEVLCEELDIDVNVLMEQMTRQDWKNLGHAHEWDRPAPAGAPHGRLAANARDVLVKAGMAKGTRGERVAREREQFRAGANFAQTIADAGKDVHEREDGRVVTGLEALGGFDKIQSDIDGIEREVSNVENKRKVSDFEKMSPTMRAHVENLRRLAKPPVKKTKGRKK